MNDVATVAKLMAAQNAGSPDAFIYSNASPGIVVFGIGFIIVLGLIVLYDVVSEILSHVFKKRDDDDDRTHYTRG